MNNATALIINSQNTSLIPYKNEIEEWLVQTASPEDQATEAGASCADCQLEPGNTGRKWLKRFFLTQ